MRIKSSVFGSVERKVAQSAGSAGFCKGSVPPASLSLVWSCSKYEFCSCAVSWKIEQLQHLLLVNSTAVICYTFFGNRGPGDKTNVWIEEGFILPICFAERQRMFVVKAQTQTEKF